MKNISSLQEIEYTLSFMIKNLILGYQWMANLWEQGINGILADEMVREKHFE